MKDNDSSIDVLKFFAIFAVVGIHTLGFVEQLDLKRLLWLNYISIDQIMRFCVPLFVALSGFTLAKRYGTIQVDWKIFFEKRIRRTIPLYLLWSAVFVIVGKIIPQWSSFNSGVAIWRILLYGQADYHLYFVPMIMCLYVLFPIALYLTKRWQFLFIVSIFVLQLTLFAWISQHQDLSWRVIKPFYSDQEQYIFFGSWITYFVIGIYLGLKDRSTNWSVICLSVVVTVLGGFWTIFNARTLFLNGVDVLFATRFTRIPLFIYATGLITSAILLRQHLKKIPSIVLKIPVFLGKQSFLIYLGHTLVLRIIFGYLNQDVSISSLAIACLFVAFGVVCSLLVEKIF